LPPSLERPAVLYPPQALLRLWKTVCNRISPARVDRFRQDRLLLKLAERLMPDAQVRRQVMWDTPQRLFGFC
jgi:hypothetical protein